MTRTTFISTLATNSATRQSLLKSQVKLATALKEADTSRYADVGLSLGYATGQAVSFRQTSDRLQAIKDSNAAALTRLDVTQSALTKLKDSADSLLNSALLASGSVTGTSSISEEAKVGLGTLADVLNQSHDGAYLFAGINSDVKPLTTYFGTAAQASVQTAFAALGPPDQITPAQIESFIDSPAFQDLFNDANWKANWSTASDRNVQSRISTTETIETSTNSNETAFRKIAAGYVLLGDLSNGSLKPETQQALAKKAAGLVSEGLSGIAKIGSVLGVPQQRISDSNDRIDIQKGILQTRIDSLEGVDPNEAATRVSALRSQIELSYALSGKLQELNILNYL